MQIDFMSRVCIYRAESSQDKEERKQHLTGGVY